MLPVGIRIHGGLVHESVARRLVHLLKYQGLGAAAEVLAGPMAAILPSDTAALVPVPRAGLRRMRYGCDPAAMLAEAVGVVTGVPVAAVLRAGLWWPAHAGRRRGERHAPRFHLVARVPESSVLVDDVFTTGATLAAASAVTGLRRAVTATRAGGGPAR